MIAHPTCSYSPQLSRRCTHLAAPASTQPHSSEKLHSAKRNQQKWGLRIVTLDWLLRSAEQGQRLDESAFPVLGGREALGAHNFAVGPAQHRQQAAGGSFGRADSTVADTCHGRASRAGSGALSPRPGHGSVDSEPHSGCQPSVSLHTQSPAIKQHSSSMEQQIGAVMSTSSGAATPRIPAVVPSTLRFAACAPEPGEDMALDRLPMTQAGFLPCDDLLAQLRVTAAHGDAYSPLQRQPVEQPGPSASAVPDGRPRGASERHGATPARPAGAVEPMQTKPASLTTLQRQPAASVHSLPVQAELHPQQQQQHQQHISSSSMLAQAPPAHAASTRAAAFAPSTDINQLLSQLKSLPRAASAASSVLGQGYQRMDEPAAATVLAAQPVNNVAVAARGPSSEPAGSHRVDELVQHLQSIQRQQPAAGAAVRRPVTVGDAAPLAAGCSTPAGLVQQSPAVNPPRGSAGATTAGSNSSAAAGATTPAVPNSSGSGASASDLVQQLKALSHHHQQYTPLGQRLAAPRPRPVPQPYRTHQREQQGEQQQQQHQEDQQHPQRMEESEDEQPPAKFHRQGTPPASERQPEPAATEVVVTQCMPSSTGAALPPGEVQAARQATSSPTLNDGSSQVADSSRGVFAGMVALVDPALAPEERASVADALRQGGGEMAEDMRRGRAATHVVCHPEAALCWLSMGECGSPPVPQAVLSCRGMSVGWPCGWNMRTRLCCATLPCPGRPCRNGHGVPCVGAALAEGGQAAALPGHLCRCQPPPASWRCSDRGRQQ